MRGVNKVILIELYQSGLSIPEVAARVEKAYSTVRHHLLKAGVLRSRAEGAKNAAARGRLGSGMRGKHRVFSAEHCRSISLARTAHAESHATGLSLKPSGYIEHTRGNHKGRSQHRTVMEAHLGRRLRDDEHVHHIDGNRANNDISNLELMDASAHMAHHATENCKNRRRNENGTWC